MRDVLLVGATEQPNGDRIPVEMDQNGKDMDGVCFFESIGLIDQLPDEDETLWLRDAPSVREVSVEALEMDKSYVDSSLLNIQYVLLHQVKSAVFEQRAGKVMRESVSSLCQSRAMGREFKPRMSESSCSPGSPSGPESAASSPIKRPTKSASSSPVTYRLPERELDTGFMESKSPLEEDFYFATPSKNIDTRTYTRPKKIRTSLDPHLKMGSGSNTLTFNRGTVNHRVSPFNHNGSGNLNETFIQEDPSHCDQLNTTIVIERSSRQVSRNLSYTVKDSPTNDSEDFARSSDEFNTTFTRNPEESVSSPTDSNSSIHNISMEELHNMARLQEQSLKTASTRRTITRNDTHVVVNVPIIDGPMARPPVRTSSTDTYDIGDSNPESPGSSGLSSPIDSQSYNDISSGSPLGRSMPNLAMTKRPGGLQRPGFSIAPPMNNLQYKNHYISDSKLSHPTGSSKLSMLRTHASGPITKSSGQDFSSRGLKNLPSRLTMTNGNGLASHSDQTGGGDTRIAAGMVSQVPKSGLLPPRFVSTPLVRPSSARSGNGVSQLPAPGFSARLQSRIPAPGAIRSRPLIPRPSTTSGGQPTNSVRPRDWRDGCY